MEKNLLIVGLKNGDKNSFSQLVEQFQSPLLAYAANLSRDRDKAMDMVQNVFMRIWEKRFSLNDDINIKSYLYRAVYNDFIDEYRKNHKVIPLENDYLNALNSFIEERSQPDIGRLISIVQKEIQNLPPKCKEVFLMSKKEGLTNEEIANYLNISIKTVEGLMTRAYSTLRSNIKDTKGLFLFLDFIVKKHFKGNIHILS